ncbi:MAG: Uma2 family endonuclease [Oscillospiraceae bacterium]|jgi:Uma2 family endonuclease|nr:Uma2 family endonuclease [Oscillospiraceae bacterium]
MPLPKEKQRYTYEDYCTWDDSQRWEIIDGTAYAMSPSPSWEHQSISGSLFNELANFLKDKTCKVFFAPLDVRLNAGTHDDTVVQPDIMVICDYSKLGKSGCVGAPDLAIEIVSPSTAGRDRLLKFNAYQRAGVREYWIVDPDTKTVSVYILKNGEYTAAAYGVDDSISVHVLEGCNIDLSDVFAV